MTCEARSPWTLGAGLLLVAAWSAGCSSGDAEGAGGAGAGTTASSTEAATTTATSATSSATSTGSGGGGACVDDGACDALAEPCVCADCDRTYRCADLARDNCADDGACDRYSEGCTCNDCLEEPECADNVAACDGGAADGACVAGETCACADCFGTWSCVTCNGDGQCGLDDPCYCADCKNDGTCKDAASCNGDGVCDAFVEGCACDDCAGIAPCAGG